MNNNDDKWVVAVNDSQWLADDTCKNITELDHPEEAARFTKEKADELAKKCNGVVLQWSDDWLNFSNKLSDVKSKTKLPEGTFKNKAATIKKILLEHAKSKGHATKMINFYISRAGKNLKNKEEIMKAKKMIENCRDFSESNFSELIKRLRELK